MTPGCGCGVVWFWCGFITDTRMVIWCKSYDPRLVWCCGMVVSILDKLNDPRLVVM